MTLVLCSHLVGEDHFRSGRHRVIAAPCIEDQDYWRALSLFWRCGQTIVNVEHDMQCSAELIGDLLDCPEPLCSHAYRIYHAGGHYAHRAGEKARYAGDWIKPGARCAEFSGIGFCKITAQARVGDLTQARWDAVEMSVADAVKGRWHLHWPGVEHYHR